MQFLHYFSKSDNKSNHHPYMDLEKINRSKYLIPLYKFEQGSSIQIPNPYIMCRCTHSKHWVSPSVTMCRNIHIDPNTQVLLRAIFKLQQSNRFLRDLYVNRFDDVTHSHFQNSWFIWSVLQPVSEKTRPEMIIRIQNGMLLQLSNRCLEGYRKTIRCLKLQVIFRKRATDYMALLRKMTYKDKTSYGSSPPCRDSLPGQTKAN